MCTVTYLPVGANQFILTSNRDEQSIRKSALPPRKFSIGAQAVYYPKDQQAGGTWIATSGSNYTLCLLNGARKKHLPNPPYKRSRGLMLLDFFDYNNVELFAETYSFEGIEPFTLILLESIMEVKVYELLWDGENVQLREKNSALPMIWSSVTLYERHIIEERQQWFDVWLKERLDFDLDKIMHFHEFGGNGNEHNDLKMNRNGQVLTVSITSIEKSESGTFMKYKDVASDTIYSLRII